MTESKTSAKKLTGLEREKRALELRMTAATYQQIGDALGITPQGAYNAVIRALGKLNEKVMENAEELRTLEVQRLDSLFITMYAQAKSGHQGAVDRCLRIMERRAKLLGLDAPTKQDITSDGKGINNLTDEGFNRAISSFIDAVRESVSGTDNEQDGDVGPAE